ncbi:MAG: ParB/RepB/Spo0J family partition protein [Phycisphaerae bacterium]|nr:ParB/RepB/Spo0J family partition protein [Phycisphaerae bacterium]
MSKQSRNVNTPSRLGRGLSSLIHSSTATEDAASPPLSRAAGYVAEDAHAPVEPAGVSGEPLEVRVDEITPNPHQPRRTFQPEALAELTASIRQQGVLQPVLVVRSAVGGGQGPYVLIAGERRLRAARQAGLETSPCLVRKASQQQMLEWSLIENIQRSDLNAIERAQAYRHYMDRFSLTQAEVAERTGESRANIANYLRVLDLCDIVQAMLISGELTFGHARALAGLAGQSELQERLAKRIVEGTMSVRQAEQMVAAARDGQAEGSAEARKDSRAKPSYVLDLESQLTRATGTRVVIRPGRAKNTGRIVIDYYSLDEFERIAGSLGLRPEG